MKPLPPQLCTGKVFHRRLTPTGHQFTYPINYILFDPDRPYDLTDQHPMWSTGRWSPVQVRADDYGSTSGVGDAVSLADDVRSKIRDLCPTAVPAPGPVRLLTQPRRWGWLFNPISIFFVWPGSTVGREGGSEAGPERTTETETEIGPMGVVLEVTNTPWKERHQYPTALKREDDGSDGRRRYTAEFDKVLHVSPFLDEDYHYRLTIDWIGARPDKEVGRLGVRIDVLTDDGDPVVETKMDIGVEPASRAALGMSLRRDGFPTHRTSFGIHRQALSLARKRVPFVAHPRSRSSSADPGQVGESTPTSRRI